MFLAELIKADLNISKEEIALSSFLVNRIAQLNEYKNILSSVKEDVSSLKKTLEDDVASLELVKAQLESQIATNKDLIEDKRNKLNSLEESIKKAIADKEETLNEYAIRINKMDIQLRELADTKQMMLKQIKEKSDLINELSKTIKTIRK